MKLPRDLNGEDLARHLERHWKYTRVHQTGSHIVLRTADPFPHTVSVPAHKPLKPGTLAIVRSVAEHKGVARTAILGGF